MPHSKDGTFIYADAAGDPSKPCLVFVHGAHLSAIVWDDLFVHHKLLDLFYLVRNSPWRYLNCVLKDVSFG